MIAAWRTGDAINSSNPDYAVAEHENPQGHSQFTFDLPTATIASETSPFEDSTATGSETSSSTGYSTTGYISPAQQAYINNIIVFQKAHGIIMGVTVVLLFPIGALSMRLFGNARLHMALQTFSLICLIAGFGLGINLAKITFQVRRIPLPYALY